MKKIEPITIGIIIFTLVIFGGVIIAAFATQNAPIPQYGNTDQSRPQLEISETSFDFGLMKVDDVKVQEIPLQNKGSKPLVISDIYTSCDCTFAQLVINGRESPKFAMNRDMKWRGEILPGESAVLRVIYEPRIMPVKGVVKREVIFKTNDPEKPLTNIRFQAVVE
jgi:hypothetical protein